ncbi:MAG: hypothetical protein E6K74_10200 [Candidatus Eisenbacteria bacterium]|uniref:Fibronectin type-III domain-containing protein n=1 Tax=Eiseniibacteriota bacterium TaxID=2212470 RepID=A0A538SP89_UNCEI|nr:MAG: hypothetical protein E6K74_10200 [Candidatus Eisenbacteria bacterium]
MPLTSFAPFLRGKSAAASVLLLSLGLFPSALTAFPLQATDIPNDGGSRIGLSWRPPPNPPPQWVVLRAQPEKPFAPIDTIGGDQTAFTDETARNGIPYQYRLAALNDATFLSDESPPATARASWFDTAKTNVAVVIALFFALVLYYIAQAERGKKWTFRTIAGLNAIEEAIGRSTEMGKGVLYVPGVQDIDDIQTIASMIILGNVARMAAKYETPLLVPTPSPAVYTVADEVVKGAYSDVGRVDSYRSDQVRYITTEQFAYVAAVNGIMLRDRPAANLLLGAFFAESLLLAETGHEIGAIQIAGTANVHQLPFFVVACDYTLIGEEYYAASAYLSKDARLLGSLKASDTVKILLVITIVVGSVLLSMGHSWLAEFFATQ